MHVGAAARVTGELEFAGDKSISHRLALISLLNEGQIEITNLSDCVDVKSSLLAATQLGVKISYSNNKVLLQSFISKEPHDHTIIDCGNSGTTARLLAGILTGRAGRHSLIGDESLSRRPMQRIVGPLSAMNAQISSAKNGRLPLTITGSNSLRAIEFANETGSAQVKSAILLAALQAKGKTQIFERYASRDHTERLLIQLNLPVELDSGSICLEGPTKLTGNHSFAVPGDISSAAFFAVAASILPDSQLILKNVLLNPTRTGFLKVLQRMGASVKEHIISEVWEPRGNLSVNSACLSATDIDKAEIPALIDELPALAIAMAFANGISRVRGASELRHKETDRIRDLISQLKIAGVDCQEYPDGFEISGPAKICERVRLDSCNDHRLAMSFAIMALNSRRGLEVTNTDSINISFPNFFTILSKCAQPNN
ncbi:MAG: 3-phosphoshikimate 1-carboxyvinyltransferase [Candidatus Riflebacteria bacterium]|nr:3-phosphoshikimate 1-carboxyvinyltransferase [Candidatus Riflebacteria bacterium]